MRLLGHFENFKSKADYRPSLTKLVAQVQWARKTRELIMSDEMHDMMQTYPPSVASTLKAGELPEGFAWYLFDILFDHSLAGKSKPSGMMRVTGAVFREAKKGSNKGKKVVRVAGTVVSVLVNKTDIAQAEQMIEQKACLA